MVVPHFAANALRGSAGVQAESSLSAALWHGIINQHSGGTSFEGLKKVTTWWARRWGRKIAHRRCVCQAGLVCAEGANWPSAHHLWDRPTSAWTRRPVIAAGYRVEVMGLKVPLHSVDIANLEEPTRCHRPARICKNGEVAGRQGTPTRWRAGRLARRRAVCQWHAAPSPHHG